MGQITPLYHASSGLFVAIDDGATPYLAYLAETFPREMKSALKSLGWYMRGKIVQGLQSSAPGGNSLAPLSLIQRIKLLDSIKTVKKRGRPLKYAKGSRFEHLTAATPTKAAWNSVSGVGAKPYGNKMVKAVRYIYDDNQMAVTFGWVTPGAASFGRALGAGWRGTKHGWESKGPQPVSAQMRKLFFAAGIPLPKNKVLKTPERPVIDPVFAQYRGEIPKYLEDKVQAWLSKSLSRGLTRMVANSVLGETMGNVFMRYAA